ncbi:isocitrate/isopropylmalate dehydrogenase family protein [Minwuia thermotolerans]|uniref:isocitrate/isopropylmalate dehydrogenase family protein n=1 Tax=Minwuia thermotolerans TaxID=2056226 RepID=UPI0019D080D9|nr:isocitrate/isopropylmalate family dehydrogenase [Minwuia thermotolerans]
MNDTISIAVLPGDGIGPEVTGPALKVLDRAAGIFGFRVSAVEHPAGAGHYRDHGEALPQSTVDAVGRADATLLAAMGLPEVRYADNTEIVPQIDLREIFGLFGGVRPIRAWLPDAVPLKDPRGRDIDFVLVRESTEGLFVGRGKEQADGDRAVRDIMEVTRTTSEKLFRFSFDLARTRRKQLTLVDKANVLGSMAFFRRIFDEIAAEYPDVTTERLYVDACAMAMVQRPWAFDVMVTENMFGDILSDLGAGLIGGLGLAPSGDIGGDVAIFQPSHGTAPDIMGQGIANPAAMILSAALMLDWLGRRREDERLQRAASAIERAVEAALGSGAARTRDLGGKATTAAAADAVLAELKG